MTMIDPCDRCHRSETPGGGLLCAEGCVCRDCAGELYVHDECPSCHQTRYRYHGEPQCVVCDYLAAQPQGEAMRLFTPAPTQIQGQMTL
jgi:hypothetical protein